MQKELTKQVFDSELEELKKSLPARYGTVVCALYPHIKLADVHNTYHGIIRNSEILGYFREIVSTREKNLVKNIS